MVDQIKKYIQYYFGADTIYQCHSPLLYKFAKEVLESKHKPKEQSKVEHLRQLMMSDQSAISFVEHGAGSQSDTRQKTVSSIARSSLSRNSQCNQLYNIVRCYKPQNILEMGTSLGISTMYLALGNPSSTIWTLEGDTTVSAIAQRNFDKLDLTNINLITGTFEDNLSPTLAQMTTVDLAFIDGNHKYESTIDYFNAILNYCSEDTILIFDDIHWSQEMDRAWTEIKANKAVTLSIDLYHMGIVFFTNDVVRKVDLNLTRWRHKPWKIGIFG